ncbi:MAG: glycosyltransferase, partial [Paracoccaceae bacterium]
MSAHDDPEAPFRRWPRVRRRLGPGALWRTVRMPLRRRRWRKRNEAACAPWAKAAAPRAEGVALALGDFSGDNGLSRAALYELARLRAEHPALEVVDIGPAHGAGGGPRVHDGPVVGRLYLLSAPDTYAAALTRLPPARVAEAWRVGLWVWETPVLSNEWRFAFDVVHEIWTPSAYSAAPILAAGADVPVTIRPHAVSPPPLGTPFDRAAFGVPERAFLGLAVMDCRSCPARKNPWAHVAAWQRAFGDDPERVLVLKIRLSRRTAVVREELAEMIGRASNVIVVEDFLDAATLAGLQRAADVLVSLHRAEGYGLLVHEMLSLGTPVVATDWSANAEYARAYPAYRPVGYAMVPCRDWTRHYADRRFLWAEADVAAAAAALREVAAAASRTPTADAVALSSRAAGAPSAGAAAGAP